MGERKQKGLLTVTLIAVTDCHISSFTLNLLNTTFQIKFVLALCEDLFTKGSYRSERPALSFGINSPLPVSSLFRSE